MNVVKWTWRDFSALVKPRIAMMVLFTVAVGYFLAAHQSPSLIVLLHTLFGTALTATSANALNQWIERHSDGRMRRTKDRPLPSGRMSAWEVFILGTAFGVGGVVYLAIFVPHIEAAIVAGVTLISYVGIYTPMKSRTPFNTLIGAVPGALPPVIGWCAAGGALDREAGALFLILFMWQVPHFLAIAWLYRADSAAGGQKMLPVVDPAGRWTGRVMVATCFLLLPIGMGPFLVGTVGKLFLTVGIVLGLWFLDSTIKFAKSHGDPEARRVLRRSLVYLAGLYAMLLADGILPRLFAG